MHEHKRAAIDCLETMISAVRKIPERDMAIIFDDSYFSGEYLMYLRNWKKQSETFTSMVAIAPEHIIYQKKEKDKRDKERAKKKEISQARITKSRKIRLEYLRGKHKWGSDSDHVESLARKYKLDKNIIYKLIMDPLVVY